MFNLTELLTIIVGVLLALIFIDGLQRAIRNKKNGLEIDLSLLPEEEKKQPGEFDAPINKSHFQQDPIIPLEGDNAPKDSDKITSQHSLLIVNLNCSNDSPFTYSSLKEKLDPFRFSYEKKGYFTFRDFNNATLFNLVNAKKPGVFQSETSSSDIALVLDPNRTINPVEAFDLLWSVTQNLSEVFECSILDENRNILTQQMVEHMRYKAQEYQRQQLVTAG